MLVKEIPDILLIVMLLKDVEVVPPMVCIALPEKFTVPDPGVKVPPFFVQLPETVNELFVPPLSKFPEISTSPLTVWFRLLPKFNVPPVPEILSPPADTLLCNVAVPDVFVIETIPDVVKPEIL